MKKLALWLLALALPVGAQTFHYPAVESNNTWAGTNIFNSTTTFNGTLNITNPLGANLTAPRLFQLSDPAGGPANALQDATQHYVDTALMINMKGLGCSTGNPDNSACLAAAANNLSLNRYYLPPGVYDTKSCVPIPMASHFSISGAAWGASEIHYTGTASSTTPTNTTGWWTSGATFLTSTVAPHVGDSVMANQDIAGLTVIGGIQQGTTVTSVTGSGPFVVNLSLPTTATFGSSGAPVPISFGWQCIFSFGADDTNWFTIENLGFSYASLPTAPTDSQADYPATAILFNTSGLLANGIHDFSFRNLYFVSGSRGIASAKNTVGSIVVPVWGGNFENVVGAQGIAPGTYGASQPGAVITGLQGATVNLAVKTGKSGGSPRLSFKNIYNRQTSVEPQMTIQNVSDLTLKNLESNSGENVLYDFDNDYDAHLDGSHNEFYIVTTNDHAMMNLSSSSIEVSNVDIQAHICPVGTACATAPASPEWQAFGYRGSVPGTLTVDNINLRTVYPDSLGYCQTTGTWTAGQTTLTLNTPSGANCPAGLSGIVSGQSVNGLGIRPLTVVTVSGGPTYALSLPAKDSGSSITITFSTYTSYVSSVGSGAVGQDSHIGGTSGFNATLLPGDASNNHFISADNSFWSNPCYVSKPASSTASPSSFYCPSILSTGTGSTNGIPANDTCTITYWFTGVGTFPASQYREQAVCHDNGAGGLSSLAVYESDNAVRGSESFVKVFTCDKLGNCTSPLTLTTGGLNTFGNGATAFTTYLKAGSGNWSFLPDAVASTGVNFSSPSVFWAARYQHAGGSSTDQCSLTNTALSLTLADPNMAFVLSCSGSPGTHIFNLSGLTPPATDNTNAVPTTAWVNTFVAANLGAQAAWFATGSPSAVAGQAVVANKIVYFDFNIPQAVTVSKITYKVITFDNTANIYDIAVLTANGQTVLLSLGGQAGTTFAPAAGTGACNASSLCTQPFTGSTILAPGHYILALTSNCAASCAVLSGSAASVWTSTNSSSGVGTTTAGVMAIFTPNTVSYSGSAAWWGVTLHN